MSDSDREPVFELDGEDADDRAVSPGASALPVARAPYELRGAERRQNARRMLRAPSRLHVTNIGLVPVRSLDVSVSGIGLIGDVSLPLASECTVFSELPDGFGGSLVAFGAKARLVYCGYSARDSGFRLGLEFTEISERSLARVAAFVQAAPAPGIFGG